MLDSAGNDTGVTVAIITGVASLLASVVTLCATVINTPLKYWLDKKSIKDKLNLDYEQVQRTRIRDLVLKYRGLALESAEALDHRFWNLYKNDPDNWLDVAPPFENHYYFQSWIYRIMKLLSIARAFEQEALFIDPRLAEEYDYDFVHLLKSWSWVVCDVSLYEGINYDHSRQKDHVFRDTLREMCEELWIDGKFVSRKQFRAVLSGDELLMPICRLFLGLKSSEARLRWDRLVCLHLLVLVFLSQFGYESQQPTDEQMRKIAALIKEPSIRRNLGLWLPRLGLMRNGKCARLSSILQEIETT